MVIDRATSRLAQIDATYSQFYENIDQVTFDASFPGNQAANGENKLQPVAMGGPGLLDFCCFPQPDEITGA